MAEVAFPYSFRSASSSGPRNAARVASQHQKTPATANAAKVNDMVPEGADASVNRRAGEIAATAAPSPRTKPKTTSNQCSLSTNL